MKFKPLSLTMMREYLAGLKDQTRRLIRPQPWRDKFWWYWASKHTPVFQCNPKELLGDSMKDYAPIQPGELLWWREILENDKLSDDTFYRADWAKVPGLKWRWKNKVLPARFMPKEACRGVAECLGVRAERVQEISEKDALAEGVVPPEWTLKVGPNCSVSGYAVSYFRETWDSLHGPGAWERNEWVWVYRFRPLKGDELKDALATLKGEGR